MCGRYVSARSVDEVAATFDARPADDLEDPGPDWNVAPTKPVLAVVERPPRGESDAEPVRTVRTVRWGLVPSWAKDPSIGSRLINARVETAADKPAFRRAAAARRCLLPADGWYEWQTLDLAEGRVKQPFLLRPADGSLLAFAGLYEFWRDRGREDEDPAAWLVTCTVLTTTAEGPQGEIHDRCPMVLPDEHRDAWLDPAQRDATAALALPVPATLAADETVAVGREVNDVRNAGPQLVAEVPDPRTGVVGQQPTLL